MDRIGSIVARLPRREFEIQRRFKTDEKFRSVCADFDEVATALDYWRNESEGRSGKIGEYETLLGELEEEIVAMLDAERRAPLDKHPPYGDAVQPAGTITHERTSSSREMRDDKNDQ